MLTKLREFHRQLCSQTVVIGTDVVGTDAEGKYVDVLSAEFGGKWLIERKALVKVLEIK